MKITLAKIYFLAAITIFITSCSANTEGNSLANSSQDGELEQGDNSISGSGEGGKGEKGNSASRSGQDDKWEKLVMFAYRDQNGNVSVEVPYPASWKVNPRPGKGEPSITGPHDLKITDHALQSFMYAGDPYMQQLYMQSGQSMRPMPGVDAIVQQDLKPWCAQRGLSYVRHYEVPEVTKIDKWYNDQLYKAVPSQSDVVAIGTEWKSADGSPFFLLMHLFVSTTSDLQTWYYFTTSLSAKKEYYEAARKQLIFSQANARYNPEPIMAYNRREAEKAGQSWAAHNRRMAQNQANFEASQRAFVNSSNAINESIMSGWEKRNASSDKSHDAYIDMIREEENVSGSNGQQYKVESGYNQYWMNSDGQYISTDRVDYNPNLDEGLNNQNWEQLKKVDD